MQQRYEYDFVRLGEGWLGVKRQGPEEYRDVINERARDGWRLVQVFAPGVGAYGTAKYYELIFEREVDAEPAAASTPTPSSSSVPR